MKILLMFLLAAGSIHLDIVDVRGKKASGVTVESGEADANGWRKLRIVKAKPGTEIIWPFDSFVKEPDGPGAIPVVVGVPPVASTYTAAGEILRDESCGPAPAIPEPNALDRGVALLCAGKAPDAVDPLATALRERERQLTRVPSEIFAAAMLYGKGCLAAGKYDDAAVGFLKALRQRPAYPEALRLRAEALAKAGKPEAAAAP